jgi:nitrous oxide reductase accessory protein NosL
MSTALLLLLACTTGQPAVTQASAVALDAAEAECAVCSMFVSEQPAPRGQFVYRDGTHHFVCSIEEMRAIMQTPSPLGRPVAAFVEVLPSGFDPSTNTTAPLPWVSAEEAWFVFGAGRPLVMGTPVLSFSSSDEALRQAATLGTTPIRWPDLVKTPFDAVPTSAHRTPRK